MESQFGLWLDLRFLLGLFHAWAPSTCAGAAVAVRTPVRKQPTHARDCPTSHRWTRGGGTNRLLIDAFGLLHTSALSNESLCALACLPATDVPLATFTRLQQAAVMVGRELERRAAPAAVRTTSVARHGPVSGPLVAAQIVSPASPHVGPSVHPPAPGAGPPPRVLEAPLPVVVCCAASRARARPR